MLYKERCIKDDYVTTRKSKTPRHNYYGMKEDALKRRCNQRKGNTRLATGMRINGLIGKEIVYFSALKTEEE